MKATFLTDFLHTTIALILIIYFTLAVLTNEHIGGLSGLYDKVQAANFNIPGNYAGSLLSFKSKGAIMFGLVQKFVNIALVIMVWIPAPMVRILLTILGHCFLAEVICIRGTLCCSGI